ncbi:MAG: hypothetical protein K0S09_2873 [Sphingobacteriaceae bacterium]|jgi:hypothetical protein|nr:hypothetical protein [Sphingobacteriaceae bacterium]
MFNRPLIWLLLLLIVITIAIEGFRNYSSFDKVDLFHSGYPRAFFFRRSEGLVVAGYEKWSKTFSRLGGIMGKTQEEELIGRSASLPFFQKFKAEFPSQAVFLHYNGNARDPLQNKNFFDGHWLYYEGTQLLQDVPASSVEMVIKVAKANIFKIKTGRGNLKNDDLAICRLNSDGSPDWNHAEQLKLVSADYENNTLTVLRGQYGSSAKAFAAGKSLVSPHAVEGPWGDTNNLLWLYNHSAACPRDKNGNTCDDILVSELASKFNKGGEMSMFDGLEFDVLWNELKTENNTSSRKIDVNADGKGDNGIVNGVNLYSIGVFNFCKAMRSALGPEKLIMADGMTTQFQRGVGYLNGIESEGWPDLRDTAIIDWAGGWNRHQFWTANAFKPAFSYINFKYAQNIEEPPIERQRLVWAAAQLLGVGSTSSGVPIEKPKDGIMIAPLDELFAGTEQKRYWLGMPTSGPVRLAFSQPDLLNGVGTSLKESFLDKISGEGISKSVTEGAIRVSAARQNLKFQIGDIPAKNSDIVISMKIKGKPRAAYPAGMPRLFTLSSTAQPFKQMSFVNDKWFDAIFYFRDVKEASIALNVEIESFEDLFIKDIKVYAYPDAVYRRFENGIVLINPSRHPFTFNLDQIAPGINYARLKGTQDPGTNNGQPVGKSLTLGERQGLFLRRVK